MCNFNLQKLTENVKSFFNEFRYLDFANLSESKIQGFIDSHKLDIPSMLSEYSEQPKSY